jgi:glycosyltransferase involved in cell wall biosynthesis
MKEQGKIICASPIANTQWRWFADDFPKYKWEFYYMTRKSLLERIIRRPNLAMIRASWKAALACRDRSAKLLFTHDPRMTFWCSFFMGRKNQIPHIAWSFSFSALPIGLKRSLMRRAFQHVDRFVVYSKMEKRLYSDYFSIGLQKFDFLLWGVGHPKTEPSDRPLVEGNYICALGGNRRDYPTLIEAMKMLPEISLHMVVRPENLKNIRLPSNVHSHVNLSNPHAMNVLAYSRFMVLPLTTDQVAVGHVTLVAAQHLGKATIVADVKGIRDYVKPGENAALYPACDSVALAEKIKELWRYPKKREVLKAGAKRFAMAYCNERYIREHLSECIYEHIQQEK